MNTSNNQEAGQTVGVVGSDVFNGQYDPPLYKFASDAHRIQMYRNNGQIHVLVSQTVDLGLMTEHFLAFSFGDIPADSSTVLDFSDSSKIFAQYGVLEGAAYKPYLIKSGKFSVSLDDKERLWGAFNCQAQFNSEQVHFENGQVDLTGFITPGTDRQAAVAGRNGVGTLHGKMSGGPSPVADFSATEVQRIFVPANPIIGLEAYWLLRAYWYDEFPPIQNLVVVTIVDGAVGNKFDLAGNTDVAVTYLRFNQSLIGEAIAGTLEFFSRPETGQAVGESKDVKMTGNSPADYVMEMAFNIT
ncbi:hypothetical protein [Pseudomonas sp. 18175]|uniref:hypothetical protein n=1 Tax=Pseudomonas sp. 18175 TaxID=3390056 RepID=UPI003D1B2908